MTCQPTSLERVYGDTDRAVVLCPDCGAAVDVDPWIRAREAGGGVKLVCRVATLTVVPPHEPKNSAD